MSLTLPATDLRTLSPEPVCRVENNGEIVQQNARKIEVFFDLVFLREFEFKTKIILNLKVNGVVTGTDYMAVIKVKYLAQYFLNQKE